MSDEYFSKLLKLHTIKPKVISCFDDRGPELSLIILCYRAGEFVREFVKHAKDVLESAGISDYELVLVANYLERDKDITPDIVAEIGESDSRVIYSAEKKQGMMGWDMRCGLNLAQGRYIAVIDGDGQMSLEDVVNVYKKIKEENLDLVKTYRIKRGDNTWRKIVSYCYNMLFCMLFPGFPVKDVNSKPKILTRDAYKRLNLTSNDWFTDAEIMIQARREKFRIGEVPTVFLGLTGRHSFVKLGAVFEFIKNLIIYRIKEFL